MRDQSAAQGLVLSELCRSLSDLSPQPMVAVEGATHVVCYLNEAFARLVGQSRSDLLGRNFAEAIPEGKDNAFAASLDRVFRTGSSEQLVEQRHKQSPPAYWSYVAWAVLGPAGRPAGVMIQVTNVTETALFRRQLTEVNQALVVASVRQHELVDVAEKLNASLKTSEGEYRQLSKTFEEQATALGELHQRKDEFLAMLSHELRNPLAPILNATYLLRLQSDRNRLLGIEDTVLHQSTDIIERQVRQLAHLVDDLLEVSRITTGRIQLHQEWVSLGRVVEDALATVRSQFEVRKHELTIALSPQDIGMYADASRLEQVVVNLLDNAAKYTEPGGHIWLTLQQEGDQATLRVRDTGMGIAPDVLPRIFDLFAQADRSLDRSQGGLGIGLALVQRLVEMHGGTVEATSALGQGSEFVVRLPVVSVPASQPPPAPAKGPEPTGPSLRVLVADDNVDSLATLAMLLKECGHQVHTACDGSAVEEAALAFRPNVVLLDIGLPKLDGFEIAKRLRQHTSLQYVILIALTGYGQESDRERSKEAGFDYHLVKPTDFGSVLTILASISATPQS